MILTDHLQIRLLSLIVSLISFAFFVASDVYSSSDGVVPFVAIAILGTLWSGPLTTLAGAAKYDTYQLWMPFVGGSKFVLMQAAGWFLYGSWLTCAVMVFFNISAVKSNYGALSAVGLLGCAATALLNVSVSFFETKGDGPGADEMPLAMASLVGLRMIWNSSTVVSLMLTLGGAILFSAADILRLHWVASPLLRLGALAFCVSALITHCFNGPSELEDYRIWQPFVGGLPFLTLQGFAWLFLGVTLQCALAVPADLGAIQVDGLLGSCGIVGAFSQLLLMLSLPHFDPRHSAPARHAPVSGQPTTLPPTMWFLLAFIAWPVLTLLAAQWLGGAFPDYAAQLPISSHSLVCLSKAMIYTAGPAAHALGGMMHPSYRLWQPFGGGAVHVSAQAFGWMMYSVSFVLDWVFVFNREQPLGLDAVIRWLPLGVLSQIILWLSVVYYKVDDLVALSARASAASGERRAAIALAVAGGFADALAEYARAAGVGSQFAKLTLFCGFALLVLAAAVSQRAGIRAFKTFRAWQPFRGGRSFVLLQLSGWTSFGFWATVHVVVALAPSHAIAWRWLFPLLGVWGAATTGVLLYSHGHFREEPLENETPRVSVRVNMPRSRRPTPAVAAAARALAALVDDLPSDSGSADAILARKLLLDVVGQLEKGGRTRRGFDAEEVLSLGFAGLSLALFVGADVCRGYGALSWANVCFAIACCCALATVVWGHFRLGPHRHGPDAYKHVMPFAGGFQFVTLQGTGWALVALSIVSLSTCAFISLPELPSGVVSAIGIEAFFGQLLLLSSVLVFDPPAKPTLSAERGVDEDVKQPSRAFAAGAGAVPSTCDIPRAYNWVCALLIGIGSLFCFSAADLATLCFGTEFPVLPARVCAVLAALASVPLTWWLTIYGDSTVEPGAQRIRRGYMSLQLLGWALWSFTVLLGVLFCHGVVRDVPLWFGFRGGSSLSGTLTGVSGIMAQLLILASLEGSHLGTWAAARGDSTIAKAARKSLLDALTPAMRRATRTAREWYKSTARKRHSAKSVLAQTAWAAVVVCAYVAHRQSEAEPAWVVRALLQLVSPATLAAVALLLLAPLAALAALHTALALGRLARRALDVVVTYMSEWITVPAIRAFIDWPMFYYAMWWRPRSWAQDGRRTLAGVQVERRCRYGSRPREELDVVWPLGQTLDGRSKRPFGAVLYAHGGGWVSCNSEVVLHSVTPLARSGLVVYSADYPLSPEARYPDAAISLIRALAWIRRRDGVTRVALVGDSAGANLTSLVAAALSNPGVLANLARRSGEPLHKLRLPSVDRFVSVYGILDQRSWQDTLLAPCIRFLFDQYRPQGGPPAPRLTLCDFKRDELKNYPETLIISAGSDALCASSRQAVARLRFLGHRAELREYPGLHGFMGIPAQWTFNAWKFNAAPATEDIVTFLKHGVAEIDGPRRVRYPRKDLPTDLSPVVVGALMASVSWAALSAAQAVFA